MLFVKELPSLKIHFTKLVDNYPNEPKNNIFISKGSFNFVKTLPNGPLIHKEYKEILCIIVNQLAFGMLIIFCIYSAASKISSLINLLLTLNLFCLVFDLFKVGKDEILIKQ